MSNDQENCLYPDVARPDDIAQSGVKSGATGDETLGCNPKPSSNVQDGASEDENLDYAKNYLERYGYLGVVRSEVKDGASEDEILKCAIIRFQEFYYMELDITGELDEKTMEFMKTPRCGNPDVHIDGDMLSALPNWREVEFGYKSN